MQKLLQGLNRFHSEVFDSQRELFERLSKGQAPDTLFITCSDSRVVPAMVTQTGPGELFVLRNAGNFVPPYGVTGGESATVEYAVAVLGVRDVVVCGHSDCGAVKALLNPPEALKHLPEVSNWLKLGEPTRRIVGESQCVMTAVEINVLVQLDNLRTHPSVAAALRAGSLHMHGWVYDIGAGQVRGYDFASQSFRSLEAVRA